MKDIIEYPVKKDVLVVRAVICADLTTEIKIFEIWLTVKPLKNILDTARDLGATDFVRYVEESGLQKEWSREGAFTLFAPTNEAFQSIRKELSAKLDSFRGNIENPILRYHISDSKLVSDSFQPDMTISTLYNGNRLRINKYSSGVSDFSCSMTLTTFKCFETVNKWKKLNL